jgi:hypothetical protein
MGEQRLIWIVGIYLITFTLSLAMFGAIVVALPAHYFAEDRDLWVDRHPAVRWVGIIGKNLLGLLIITLGVLLSLPGIPGQGLLTIAVGLMLLDIPGKGRLVRGVVRRPGVLRGINRLRSWFGRPPLVID